VSGGAGNETGETCLLMHWSCRENGKYALITACADGGLGHACIIERYK
jgi:hypothetical protein